VRQQGAVVRELIEAGVCVEVPGRRGVLQFAGA